MTSLALTAHGHQNLHKDVTASKKFLKVTVQLSFKKTQTSKILCSENLVSEYEDGSGISSPIYSTHIFLLCVQMNDL